MTLDCGMQRLLVVVQPQAELFVLVYFIAGIERCSKSHLAVQCSQLDCSETLGYWSRRWALRIRGGWL